MVRLICIFVPISLSELTLDTILIAGLLLDLGLDASIFAKARGWLKMQNSTELEFPEFLRLYANFACTSEQSEEASYWVPLLDGKWDAVSGRH